MSPSTLLIDAGNTRVKWGWRAPDGSVCATGACLHADLPTVAGAAWHAGSRHGNPTDIWLCNVAGADVEAAVKNVASTIFSSHVKWHHAGSSANASGVRNGYRHPAQLGADRWVSAIGAHARWPKRPLLIVTAGTATTIDVLTADGLFRGGMILPGLTLMAQSLARGTAQLPDISAITPPLPAWADNTQDAIALGCLSAQCGAIQQAWDRLSKEVAPDMPQCILSGGAQGALAAALMMPFCQHDNLVLAGLARLALCGVSSDAT
jgi:type III pantothenate kinase